MRKLDLLLLLTVFLIASFFRFYRLSDIPFGLNNDAAWEGSAALDILRGNIQSYLPYASEGWRGEGIIRITIAFFITLLSNDPITIRLASVVFGIGLIIPLFLLIRLLFNTRLAFFTTFFVALSGWHITMSKTGWRAITVPFFSTLAFYFFFRGLKTKKTVNFILTGIILAIGSLYTYDAARIILLFFVFWIVFSFLTTRDFLLYYGKNLLILTISFIITATPMGIYAANNWQNFTSRSEFLFIGHQIEQVGNLSPLWNNIVTSAFLFNVKANGNDFFIFEPLLDKPVSWLLPIGFLVVLWHVTKTKKQSYVFVMFWFVASLIPGILSTPNGNRAIGVIPIVYLFVGIGLLFLVDNLKRFLHKGRIISIISTAIFCFVSGYFTYRDYLGPNRRELLGFYPETLITTNYIKTVWDKYDIYLTDNYPRELLTYYLYKEGQKNPFARNYIWYENSLAFINSTSRILGTSTSLQPKGKAYFMFPTIQNENIANILIRKFPGAEKFYLWYDNDNIHRPASLVLLIPIKNDF